jgi:hypothetical protein
MRQVSRGSMGRVEPATGVGVRGTLQRLVPRRMKPGELLNIREIYDMFNVKYEEIASFLYLCMQDSMPTGESEARRP